MSVRIRIKQSTGISASSAEDQDLGKLAYEVYTDDMSEGGSWKTTVAAGATQTIHLDDITSAKFLSMRFTSKDPTLPMTQVLVTINGTIAIPVFQAPGTKEAYLTLTSPGITALVVANTEVGAVDLDLTIAVAGD